MLEPTPGRPVLLGSFSRWGKATELQKVLLFGSDGVCGLLAFG
jgi:hypothetical protein